MKRFYFYLIGILLLGLFSVRAQNTNGTDFWVTFGLNPAEAKSNPDLRIRIVSNEKPVKGSIYFTYSKTSIPIDIPAQTVETYDLTSDEVLYAYNTEQGKSNFSIHITTDNSVMVYVMNQNNMSTDATNILPVQALGMEYYHISYQPCREAPPKDLSDAYAVVATENNTLFYHNGTHIETLNKGEVYYKTDTLDMTGAHINSNKPVAFFALNQGPNIPSFMGAPDCLMQQLASVNTWGKTFFVPVTIKQKDIVRIVASQNNTNITQLAGGTIRNSPGAQLSPYDLQAGQFVELDILLSDNGCYIEADKPVGVCTYLTVPEYAGGNLGDPSQCWVPAIEQSVSQAFLASFVPNPSHTAINQHHVLITTPTHTKDDTRIAIGGGEPVPLSGGEWRDNLAAGMSFYNMELTDHENPHFFFNNEGIIVLCYGLGPFESYYYFAFSALRNLSAAFYANNIHYQDLSEHLFCTDTVQFHADIDNLGTEVQTIKWYVNEEEETSVQNKETWEKIFPSAGTYRIKMWICSVDEDTLILESVVNIGAQISTAIYPENGGSAEGAGCYQVGDEVTLIATPNVGYLFVNWTEDLIPVFSEFSYIFTATESKTVTAHFVPKSYVVNVDVNNSEYGDATGAGEYGANATATVSAVPNQCYQFANWTIDSVEVSTEPVYSFTVTEDVNLLANFYDLDFDTYAVMICDCIFLLNLKQLAEDGYDVTGCKWFKNGIEVTNTHTQSEFSYSEGGDKLLEMEPNYYMFQLITNNYGELCSSKKMIVSREQASRCITTDKAGALIVYPNPVLSGSAFTIEGNIKDSPILVYNHLGACVYSLLATDNIMTLTLQLPQGIYLIRTNESHIKIIITH